MPITVEQLYALLPAIHRIRDTEGGQPLRGLLSVLAEQASVVEGDIARLYDNWFIETCDEWVVPYLGDLLGVRDLYSVSSNAALSQRARIGNTIRYRRRKGTASMLEQLARDTTGWPARVVEFFQVLVTTQHVNHVRLGNLSTADLRQMNALELLGGPFDSFAHTADVRHVDNQRGKHNIRHLGIFLWRLQAFSITDAPPFAHGDGKFSFSQLGQPIPLFNQPSQRGEASALTTELDVPAPLRRRNFQANLASYHGAELSLSIRVQGPQQAEPELLEIVASNLSDWSHRPLPRESSSAGETSEGEGPGVPRARKVAVDPELGRFAFAEGESPAPENVRVSYHHGFSAELGGGGYGRAVSGRPLCKIARVPGDVLPSDVPVFSSLRKAIQHWKEKEIQDAILEIADNGVYPEATLLRLEIPAGVSLTLRAADGRRPVLQLTRALSIVGESPAGSAAPGELTIEGLLITGRGLEVGPGSLGGLHLNHCTLVPGWALDEAGNPVSPREASLRVDGKAKDARNRNLELVVRLNRCISGRLDVPNVAALHITDSIIDGTPAGDTQGTRPPTVRTSTLNIEASTVLGSVDAELIESASNVIFTERVKAERKQSGCVRFCFVPSESEVPRRFQCQPTRASSLCPQFTDLRYGQPGYAQLSLQCPPEIRAGAENEGEMGAFHHLNQPQREVNLRASFDEYLCAGLEAGLFYVT